VESLDDVAQAGTVGLMKAIDRFDGSRGVAFSTYATPTIVGEIKRHFRDHTWALRVPRGVKDRVLAVGRRTDELTAATGRAPTVAELGADLGLTDDEVVEAIEARHALTADTFDTAAQDDRHAGRLGDDEPAFATIEDREALRPLLAQLPERERQIIALRFVDELSQAQIAERLGISQMHVSRLLASTLATLRAGLADT
jgi:RNA polymerase sigma-B factor